LVDLPILGKNRKDKKRREKKEVKRNVVALCPHILKKKKKRGDGVNQG